MSKRKAEDGEVQGPPDKKAKVIDGNDVARLHLGPSNGRTVAALGCLVRFSQKYTVYFQEKTGLRFQQLLDGNSGMCQMVTRSSFGAYTPPKQWFCFEANLKKMVDRARRMHNDSGVVKSFELVAKNEATSVRLDQKLITPSIRFFHVEDHQETGDDSQWLQIPETSVHSKIQLGKEFLDDLSLILSDLESKSARLRIYVDRSNLVFRIGDMTLTQEISNRSEWKGTDSSNIKTTISAKMFSNICKGVASSLEKGKTFTLVVNENHARFNLDLGVASLSIMAVCKEENE